ncbi:hypothetical protein HPB52_019614 [Rhipicephalus sanguineus]|uniref:Rubicon PI3K-binding domain-containing protein n=1 Tax=Rhipicephalus sanguineus TaxID=34632 RepID=A0A9D4T1F1_RHISA|nr:hypothetical protein HPB52_019614 [Rhipicephalus sanguineus]
MREHIWFLVAPRTKEPAPTRAAAGRVGNAVVMTSLIAQQCLPAAHEWAASRPRRGGGEVSHRFGPTVCCSRASRSHPRRCKTMRPAFSASRGRRRHSSCVACIRPLRRRENAHIYVSEALIAAFEQMRCSRALNVADDDDDDSDEEIARLRQRIRIRRKERLREKALQQQLNKDGQPSGVWCRAPAVATTSTSPLSSAYSSPCFQVDISDNDDDIDEYELSGKALSQ